MKKRIITSMLAIVLALSTLTGCGASKENAELQASLEAMQSELDALKQETKTEEEEGSEEVKEDSVDNEDVEDTADKEVPAKEADKDTPAADVSADWTSFSFNVNGTTVTLPCSYKELADATGFSMKSSDEKSFLEGGYYTNVNLYTTDENLALYIDILNDSDGDLTYAECQVVSVGQTEYQAVEKGASMITFAGGMQVGQKMTIADIEAVFGEPQDTYEYTSDDSDYESSTWTYAEDPDYTSHNNIEFVVTNGVLDTITIDHLYYE